MTGERARARAGWRGALALAITAVVLVPVLPAAAAAPVRVLQGTTPDTAIFPNNSWTVLDSTQLTGIRVNLPLPACDATNSSLCDDIRLLNSLDGFDLQPRVQIPFSGPIDIATVTDQTVFLTGPSGSRSGLSQLVLDPAANTLAGYSTDFLTENTTYTITVTSGVHDRTGTPIDACGGTCTVAFTTDTATQELLHLRSALDDHSAFAAAGISDAQRSANFVEPDQSTKAPVTTVFPAATVTEIDRIDQIGADGSKPNSFSAPTMVLAPSAIPPSTGYVGFGSVVVPRYQVSLDDNSPYEPGVIPPVASRQTPQPLGQQRIGFTLLVPQGSPPSGGWPVAIFGPGFTRSKYDLFLAADQNAAQGFATIATDPSGHGFGPLSTAVVKQGPTTATFLSHGQGRDLDGNGDITNDEGVGPTEHFRYDSMGHQIADDPSRAASDGLRSGLIQSVVDNMVLVRMIEKGIDVPTVAGQTVHLAQTGVSYYGQSFGGIYGTMLMGTDPHIQVGVLNVPGGPIAEIARLSGFRNLLAHQLATLHAGPNSLGPGLLNGGPGLEGFTEDIPLRDDLPITAPHPGAIPIQLSIAHSNWFSRAGSPESFAPLLRLRPPAGSQAKSVIFQTAFADQTVPNPTAANIYRAGHVTDLVTYYRNDHTPTFGSDPHGFLLDPRLAGRQQGQTQMAAFIGSKGASVTPADPSQVTFETPIVNSNNLECLHYPQPQTGMRPNPVANAPDCPAAANPAPVVPEVPHGTLPAVLAIAAVAALGIAEQRRRGLRRSA